MNRILPHSENEIENGHRLIVYHRTMKTKVKQNSNEIGVEIENKIYQMKLKTKIKQQNLIEI
jgi:hypothetical protein